MSLPTAPPAVPSSELFSGEVDGDLLFLVTLRFVLDFLIVPLYRSLSLEVSPSRLSGPWLSSVDLFQLPSDQLADLLVLFFFSLCFLSSPELSTSEL